MSSREFRLQQLYIKLFEQLYIDAINYNLSPEQAQAEAYTKVEHVKEIIEGVLEELDEDGWYCRLRWVVPLDYIDNWDRLSYQEKEQALCHFGIDVNLPWREKEGYYAVGNNRAEGRFVEGSERVDQIHCSGKMASLEAIMEHETHARGESHRRDLERMSRQ